MEFIRFSLVVLQCYICPGRLVAWLFLWNGKSGLKMFKRRIVFPGLPRTGERVACYGAAVNVLNKSHVANVFTSKRSIQASLN